MSISDHAALRGRIGAHTLHATHDSRELTAAARRAFLSRFLEEVDPDNLLPLPERERRAKHALKAHMQRLALQSAKKRAAAAEEREAVELDALIEQSGLEVRNAVPA